MLPESELLPRSTIFEEEPGLLEPLMIWIPDTLPESALVMLGSRTAISWSPLTSCMALAEGFLFTADTECSDDDIH